MATNYPGSLDTSTQQPSPLSTTEMDDAGFEHDAVHTNHSGAIIALETKVGTGSSTAVANSVLAGTGSGTSGWTTTPTVVDLTATGNVDITGTLAVDGIVTLGDEIRVGSGSASDPAYTFDDDNNTGFFVTGNGGVTRWSGNGTEGGYLYSGGVRTVNGSAATPSHSFTSDADTGMYRYTTNQVALTAGNNTCLIAAAGTVNTAGLSTSTTSGYQYVLRNTTFGTLYRYTSSTDVKENITNVTASDAGAWMDALQPVTFNERWLQDGTESDEDRAFREADIQVGFVADDVLANSTIAKFAQVENVDGTLKGVGWKWECVIAAAVAEIKSLRARVADLEAA